MVPLLSALGDAGVAGLLLAVVVPTLVVALGTYIGVSMALQSFFDGSSWSEVIDEE